MMEDRPKIIAIDFDGVIADFSEGWRGVDVFGEPIEGAKEGLKWLKQANWKIIIWTSRVESPALREYLAKNDLVYDTINKCPWYPLDEGPDGVRKVVADVYLDDRGLKFEGDWSRTISLLEDFKPWQLYHLNWTHPHHGKS